MIKCGTCQREGAIPAALLVPGDGVRGDAKAACGLGGGYVHGGKPCGELVW